MMKVVNLMILYLFITQCVVKTDNLTSFFQSKGVVWNEEDTVFILVRHAEKDKGQNPSLTEKGRERAEQFLQICKDLTVKASYSTELNRTLETIEPLNKHFGLDPVIYKPDDIPPLADQMKRFGKGVYIISGHSNSTPTFANNICGCNNYKTIDESDYSNIFVVVIPKDGNQKTFTVHF